MSAYNHRSQGGTINQVYDMPGMRGFSGVIPESFVSNFQSSDLIATFGNIPLLTKPLFTDDLSEPDGVVGI